MKPGIQPRQCRNLLSFVAVKTPTVLLVDAYEPDDSSPVIDDGAYTNALAATGLGYSFWEGDRTRLTATRGL